MLLSFEIIKIAQADKVLFIIRPIKSVAFVVAKQTRYLGIDFIVIIFLTIFIQ